MGDGKVVTELWVISSSNKNVVRDARKLTMLSSRGGQNVEFFSALKIFIFCFQFVNTEKWIYLSKNKGKKQEKTLASVQPSQIQRIL